MPGGSSSEPAFMPWKTQASCISWPPMQLPTAGQESGRVIYSTVNSSILQQYSILSWIKLQCLYCCLSTLLIWNVDKHLPFKVFKNVSLFSDTAKENVTSSLWMPILSVEMTFVDAADVTIMHDTLFFQHQQTYISWCMWLIHILDIWSFFQFIWWKELRQQMKYDCKFSFLNRSWML